MKENIETKDVQRTEYLDKNGLDMLWAKVKENTRNQVEVERNRAVAKENSIIDTKADKSALDNYVLNSALTALEQKVTANTTAIEGKQDAGNYIPYKEIEGGLTYYLQDSYNIMCQKGFFASSNNYDYAAINYNCVKVAKGINNYILIDKDNIEIKDGDYAMALISANSIFSRNRNNDFNFQLTSSGIKLLGGDDNHVLTSNASTIDITEYAKKSEITAGGNVDDVQVNGVTVVENKIANIKPATKENLGVVKVGDGLNVTDGTISVDTTAIGAGNYIPYESIDNHGLYKTYITKHNEGILFDSGSGNISISNGEIIIKNAGSKLTLTSSFIWLLEISDNGNRETLLAELTESGLRLRNGDHNHVLTSYGSTIDITQYALKSVYDKKIAALEARIAALEAKHAETA